MDGFWLFRARPWAEGGQRSVNGQQLPIIKFSLIAAYLWFPLTAPSQGVRPK